MCYALRLQLVGSSPAPLWSDDARLRTGFSVLDATERRCFAPDRLHCTRGLVVLDDWWRSAWLRGLLSSKAGTAGLLAVLSLALLATFTPVVAPYDPLAQVSLPLMEPSSRHLLGTDELGRDVYSRILYGLRLSLFSAIAAATAAAAAGIAIGLIGGFFGGWLDRFSMRVMDVVLSVPTILLALVLVAVMGGGLVPLILAIAIVGVPPFARLTRASVLSVKERPFVLAQRAAGASTGDILLRTILPNVLGPAVVQLVVTASTAILTESGLNFLGLGAAPPYPSLGSMLAAGNENLFLAPLYPVLVGISIGLLVASFDAFGAGLQRVFGIGVARGGIVA
jgi:peptide/nickel transport system permease protein